MAGFAWFRPMTRFVVIRGTGTGRDGVWDHRRPLHGPVHEFEPDPDTTITLYAQGRWERRDDGALAEVYGPERPPSTPEPRSVLTTR